MRILLGCRKIIGLGIFACIVVFILSLFGGTSPKGDGLPTLAVLPSLTLTPEAVAVVATEPPGVTIIPTEVVNRSGFVTITPAPGTEYPTATITETPLPTLTNTDLPTATNLPVSSPTSVFKLLGAVTYYVTRTANIRTCASSTCEKLGQVTSGTKLTVSAIFQGEAVTGNNTSWYQVFYGGTLGYIYSAYLTDVAPVVVQPPVIIQQQPVSPIAAPVSPITSNSCPDLGATCSQLTCQQAYACLAAGNGSLDRDHDGIPCESICGG